MKKIVLVACIVAIGIAITAFISRSTHDEDNFEGVITYSQTAQISGNSTHHNGTTFKIYVKGGKTKEVHEEPCGITMRITDSNSSPNGEVTDSVMKEESIITDRGTPDDPIDLEEIKGNKYRVIHDKTKKVSKDPVIKYSDETKQILGYDCHKAGMTVIRDNGDTVTYDIYYNDNIKDSGIDIKGLKGLKGLKWLPLEISGNASMMGRTLTITTTAIKIVKESISDDEFKVPPDYKIVTEDEYDEDVYKILHNGGN